MIGYLGAIDLAGIFTHVVQPQLHPAGYLMFLHLAASCWFLAFALLLWHYVLFLIAPRADGREH